MVVAAAFTRDGRSFLIGPTFYTSYTDADLLLCQPLKPQTLRALLDELKCTNSTDVNAAAVITGAMDGGTELLFKARIPTGSEIYSFADGKIAVAKPTPERPALGKMLPHSCRATRGLPSRRSRLVLRLLFRAAMSSTLTREIFGPPCFPPTTLSTYFQSIAISLFNRLRLALPASAKRWISGLPAPLPLPTVGAGYRTQSPKAALSRPHSLRVIIPFWLAANPICVIRAATTL